jgi:hypothetical protein
MKSGGSGRTGPGDEARSLAEAVRRACIEAALHAYQDAGLQGLCQEGRWEVAVEAMRGLDLTRIIEEEPVPKRGDEHSA